MDKYIIKKEAFEQLAKSFMINADSIEKGRALPDGTVRNWKGVDYIKKNGKWIPKGKGKGAAVKPEPSSKGSAKPEPTKEITSKAPTSPTSSGRKTVSVSDNFEAGQEIEFKLGGNNVRGEVKDKGTKGVLVRAEDGTEYNINYDAISKTTKRADGTIPSEHFDATSYKEKYTDKRATHDVMGEAYIYDLLANDKNYNPKIIKKASELSKNYLLEQAKRMAKKGGTDERFTGGTGKPPYSLERQKLHAQILTDIFTPEKIKACLPPEGEQPKFIMFGGRGGSGKGWFTDKDKAEKNGREVMFDSDKFLTLDADAFKSLLPEFEGWNAGEVHEESSYLMKEAQKIAESYGMNIIIDGTMNFNPKKPNKIRDEMLRMKSNGYRIEAHYMFLPVQESSKRAIMRFAHKDKETGNYDFKGRLVPLDILLGMQNNEKSFDSVKDICDDWSFRDNNVPMGEEPKLISQKGK